MVNCCYLIESQVNTYVGTTNNLKKRLRQHNGEIKGGAKATRGKGPYSYVCVIHGFETLSQALKFEYRVKHTRGKNRVESIKNTLENEETHKYVDPCDLKVTWFNYDQEIELHPGIIVVHKSELCL